MSTRKTSSPFRVATGAIISVTLLAGAGVYMSSQSTGMYLTSLSSSSSSSPSLKCQTEYEYGSSKSLGSELSYKYVVQVQKINYLSLEDGSSVVWKVNGVEQNDGEASTSLSYFFDSITNYTVEAGDYSFQVYSKIVRREIRDLTEADREAYFSALNTMYRVDADEGKELYGATFENANNLLRRHLYGAADRSCDHWHDDAGMLTHHIGITWKFEQSLRLIDSSTSSHYWDYTRDSADPTIDWYQSTIFLDDYFGATSPDNSDHILAKGTFAYLSVKANARGFSSITNPYGLLRSPWNTNNVPYLMRSNYTAGLFGDGFSDFPTCDDFLAGIGESLGTLTFLLNGELHGPVHLMVGGHWGINKQLETAIQAVTSDGADMILLLSKDLWRQGIIRVPESCSSDTSVADCKPSCPSEIIDPDMDPVTFLERYGLSAVSSKIMSVIEYMKDDLGMANRDIIDSLCEFGFPGEMFTSAAPQDPIFWPLHGPAERYIQVLRLWKTKGLIDFDDSWGYFHAPDVPSDTHKVCDWSNVTGLELPTCEYNTCVGHRVDDLLPFEDMYDGQDGLITNYEALEFVHPDNEDMPYIFDSLDTWKGCSTDESLYQSYLNYDGDSLFNIFKAHHPMMFGAMGTR